MVHIIFSNDETSHTAAVWLVCVETGDTAAVCLSTEATKDWPHGRRVF